MATHHPARPEEVPVHCSRCGLPHRGAFPGASEHSLQGAGCAASFAMDGSLGMAHYGSIHDGDSFEPAPPAAKLFAGLDPVCDACLGSAMLSGQAFGLGERKPRSPLGEREARNAQAEALAEQFSLSRRGSGG